MVCKITVHVFALLTLLLTITAQAYPGRASKMHVHFLATSTSVREHLGQSQDVYLIEITTENDGPVLARLVDQYPPYGAPLSSEVLTSSTGTTLKITRDRMCDIGFAQMPLRTAPGDPMAILAESLGFRPRLARAIAPSEVLPCYRTVKH
jgi:hypothetical protein